MRSLLFGCCHRELVVQVTGEVFALHEEVYYVTAILLTSLQDFRLVIIFLSSYSCIFGVFCSVLLRSVRICSMFLCWYVARVFWV